ncbi:hypothetical protein KIPB_012990 [Kipferlia bialata]|uniref:Uncharacterized protein n=1 Tax=Kipferlia bialata TaxID=797122 RepID=A0A9K3D8W6_9EUKA|nr:hypothetical protein KIPB_012990 [Kipferlia bialata]|eukprot:g12990.t1
MPFITPYLPAFAAVSTHLKSIPDVPLLAAPEVQRGLETLLTYHRTLVGSTPDAPTPYGSNVCIGLPCMPKGLPKDLRKALPKSVVKTLHKSSLLHPVSLLTYGAYATVAVLAAEVR